MLMLAINVSVPDVMLPRPSAASTVVYQISHAGLYAIQETQLSQKGRATLHVVENLTPLR